MPGLIYVVSISRTEKSFPYKFDFDYLNDACEFIKFCLRASKVKLYVMLQVEYVKGSDEE